LLGSEAVPKALARDYRSAELSAADRTMLAYAVKLTAAPHSVTQQDVEALKREGFDDAGVLDICQVVSYYNYVNRLADGLGVEMEAVWSEEDLTLTRSDFDVRVDAKRAASEVK
jgi:uncharacterized peroxidase-related enzyme